MIDQYINYANAFALGTIAAYVMLMPQSTSRVVTGAAATALAWLVVQALVF